MSAFVVANCRFPASSAGYLAGRHPGSRTLGRIVMLVGSIAMLASPGTGAPAIDAAAPQAEIQPTSGSSLESIRIEVPGGIVDAAVARPPGPGPFPVALILHGSHGFARQYVELAQALAEAGTLAVAACWFRDGGGAGARFVEPIPCPDGPSMSAAASPEAQATLTALVRAVRNLDGALPDQVALIGHSRGAGAALNHALVDAGICAVAANSAGYPVELDARAGDLSAPLLILHGVLDDPAEGGSAFTNVAMARRFEAALRRAQRPVEAIYYPQGGHNSLFTDAEQRRDATARIGTFLLAQFRRGCRP
jgi:dienelactone hydrolase